MNGIIIFVSGVMGGLARMELNDWIPRIGVFPIGTVIINLLGCFSFAFFAKRYLLMKHANERIVLAVGTGFIGTFTTFSSALTDTITLFNSGHYLLMLFYLLLEAMGGLLMIVAGLKLGGRVIHR